MPYRPKLRELLEKHATLIIKHNIAIKGGDLTPYYKAMQVNATTREKLQTRLFEHYYQAKRRPVPAMNENTTQAPVVKLITLTTNIIAPQNKTPEITFPDTEEKSNIAPSPKEEKIELHEQDLPEQIILYHLFKRITTREFKSATAQADMQKIFKELEPYSFDWLRYRAQQLLKLMAPLNLDDPKLTNYLNEFININQRLPELVWSLGYTQSAIHYLELLYHIKKQLNPNLKQKEVKRLIEGIQQARSLALQNIIQCRLIKRECSLEVSNYMEQITEMYVEDKNPQNLYATGYASRDVIPTDMNTALTWLEKEITDKYTNIHSTSTLTIELDTDDTETSLTKANKKGDLDFITQQAKLNIETVITTLKKPIYAAFFQSKIEGAATTKTLEPPTPTNQ